jgi:hypothetical protein
MIHMISFFPQAHRGIWLVIKSQEWKETMLFQIQFYQLEEKNKRGSVK